MGQVIRLESGDYVYRMRDPATTPPVVAVEPIGNPQAPLYRARVGALDCCPHGHLLPEEAAHHLGDVVKTLAMQLARMQPKET